MSVETTWAGVSIVAAALALWLGVQPLVPPDPLPVDAPATEFSAVRAMDHVRRLAVAPRPIGSTNHAAALKYISQRLAAIGLEPIVQETQASITRRGVGRVDLTVRNVVATLAGASPSKAVMLVAHYDSARTSPGASDNAAGVATLLETARALLTSSHRKDVMLLFTDGEETGLLGARAFVRHHPRAAHVGVVLNFDARGSSGPVVMFETSGSNQVLVDELSSAVRYPVATSLSEDVYRRMPNTTDFRVFRERGFVGLNFAFFARPQHYHNADDTVDHLDPRTVQHLGVYALALARRFANTDRELAGEERAAYFNIGRTLLLHHPLRWVLPLAAMTFALWLAVLAVGFQKRLLTIRGVAVGALAFVVALAAAAATGYGFERWIADAIGARAGRGTLYVGFACGTAGAIVPAIYRLVGRRIGTGELLAPALGGWVLLALALALAVPGASYLFLWPAMAGVVLLGSIFLSSQSEEAIGPRERAWLAGAMLPAFVLLTPAIGLVFNAVGPAVITSAAAVCTAMTVAWFVPVLKPIVGTRRRRREVRTMTTTALATGLCVALACVAPSAEVSPKTDDTVTADPPRFVDPDRRARLATAFDDIDAQFRDYAVRTHVPGAAWGIVIDGELVHWGAAGDRDVATKAPVDADTVFRIASMTKSFTAMAILSLRDEGKLALDDPAERFVPELETLRYPTSDSPRITIRHLLSHSEGFPEDNPWGDQQLALSEEQMTRMLRRGIPFSNPPGVAFEYSNYGFAILGRIVAHVSGMPYAKYIATRILKPLGMTSTTMDPSAVPPTALAHGYRWQDNEWQEAPLLADGTFAPMGGMLTSVRDLSRYVSALLDAWPARNGAERGPIRRASLREMQQLVRFEEALASRGDAGGTLQMTAAGYGYGLTVSQTCAFRHVVSHSGGLPGFGSRMQWLPEYGVGIIVLGNRTYTAWGRAVGAAFDSLVKTGGLQPRVMQPSPALVAARNVISQLIVRWDDQLAASIAAENLFLDESAERRRKALDALHAKYGACTADRDTFQTVENALRGRWIVSCERGSLHVNVTLAPTMPPRVQYLSIRPPHPADATRGQACTQ